jgi:hypothetical protein
MSIADSYSTGKVTGNSEVGGRAGDKDTTATSSYWDMETSGQTTSPAGEGKTTPQMKRLRLPASMVIEFTTEFPVGRVKEWSNPTWRSIRLASSSTISSS